jgi:hypothetical protein
MGELVGITGRGIESRTEVQSQRRVRFLTGQDGMRLDAWEGELCPRGGDGVSARGVMLEFVGR